MTVRRLIPVPAVYPGRTPMAAGLNPLPLAMSLGHTVVWSRDQIADGWELRLLLRGPSGQWGLLLWPYLARGEHRLQTTTWEEVEKLRESMAAEVRRFDTAEACQVFIEEHDWGHARTGAPVLALAWAFLASCQGALRDYAPHEEQGVV